MENDSKKYIMLSTCTSDYFYKTKLVLCSIGILVGLLLLVSTIAKNDFFFGLEYYEFGADFYTEIYKAVSRVNENVCNILSAVEGIGRTIKIMLGFGFTLGFGLKLLNVISEHNRIVFKENCFVIQIHQSNSDKT